MLFPAFYFPMQNHGKISLTKINITVGAFFKSVENISFGMRDYFSWKNRGAAA